MPGYRLLTEGHSNVRAIAPTQLLYLETMDNDSSGLNDKKRRQMSGYGPPLALSASKMSLSSDGYPMEKIERKDEKTAPTFMSTPRSNAA